MKRLKFPRPTLGMAWLYLIGRPGGRVKVGRTKNPTGRMIEHRHAEWRHYCAYGSHAFIVSAEQAAMRALRRIGTPTRHASVCEEFAGPTREQAIVAVRAAVAFAREHAETIEGRAIARENEKGAWQEFRSGLLLLAKREAA